MRGRGGAPAALPLTLLWYVPVRAALREHGEGDIELADYTATLPLAFLLSKATRRVLKDDSGLAAWTQAIQALPRGTVAQGEQAAYLGSLALWWTGVFPESIRRRGQGEGMVRGYVEFASRALRLAANSLRGPAPGAARLYAVAAERCDVMQQALSDTASDYLGPDAHTSEGRLGRYLNRLGSNDDTPLN